MRVVALIVGLLFALTGARPTWACPIAAASPRCCCDDGAEAPASATVERACCCGIEAADDQVPAPSSVDLPSRDRLALAPAIASAAPLTLAPRPLSAPATERHVDPPPETLLALHTLSLR